MNKSLIVLLMVISASPPNEHRGYVSGTVASVSDGARTVPCGGLTLIVSRNGHKLAISANQSGDYSPKVDTGKYELQAVLDKAHRELTLRSGQARDFLVKPGKVTKFDVLLDSPCPSEPN